MEKQFATYKIALKLKELGFNERTKEQFDGDFNQVIKILKDGE